MNNPIKSRKFNPIARMTSSLVLLVFFGITATALADVATAPLFLTTNVKPNVMLMLDNSISMGATITPEGTTYNPATTYLGGLCTYSTSSSLNKAMSTSTTYTTSVPSGFLGKGSGNKCFASNRSYTFNSEMNTKLAAANANNNAKKANYANWFYTDQLTIATGTKTRLAIAKTSASNLVDFLSNVRLGFSTFNADNGGKLWEVIDDLGTTKKSNIKNRINATNNDAHTPLSETMADIGNYFATGPNSKITLHAGESNPSTPDKSAALPSALVNGTAWSGRTAIPAAERSAAEPTFTTPPIQYSCQKSFAVLLTDGLPSSDRDISTNTYLKDYDGDCTGSNSSQCTSYDMKKVYAYPGGNGGSPNLDVTPAAGSNSSDYLDDVTKALYEMDLRPDLRNADESERAKNNITTYVVGFADDAINPTMAGVNPLPKNAAINAGGQFYYAGNETELTASLISTFQFIIEKNSSSSSSVTTNSTQFQTDTLIYQALFDSNDWRGTLLAIKLLTEDTNGNNQLDSGEDTNGNGKIDTGIIGPQQWDASALIPDPGDRHIYSYNPAATTTKGIEFLWGNLNATQKQVLDTARVSASSSPILDYLRGDRSKEGTDSGDYRVRSSVLGDIVNSDPLFVGKEDLGYGSLAGTEGSSYTAFRTGPSYTSRRSMIYVGANDGMLHGFDAGLGVDGGKEIFAYLPNAVISSDLVTLTSLNYNHRYFVDGSPQYGDAYFNNSWHTVLVGSMGAGNTTVQSGTSGTGGRALFALDVTNPDDFASPAGAEKVLWEFSSRDDADLGYTLPQPGIVRMANGQWAAIVANGYNSASGKAVLFIIDIQTGSIIKKIEAETATGTNGLSSPVAVDIDNDRIVNYIYAGDLKGNLWKFDVSSSDTANWGLAYSGAPLFLATDKATFSPQSITSKLAIGKATAAGQSGGVMIYFGTGKYFESTDDTVGTNPQVQSFYGLWDDNNGPIAGRANLQEQTIDHEGVPVNASGTAGTGLIRVTSRNTVCYSTATVALADDDTPGITCSSNLKKGWVMDFLKPVNTAQGERVVSTPVFYRDLVIFSTLIPSTELCKSGGESRLILVEALTGKRPATSSFDLFGGTSTARDSKVGSDDLVMVNDHLVAASGLSLDIGIHKNLNIVGNNGYASGSDGELGSVSLKTCDGAGCPPPPCDGAGCSTPTDPPPTACVGVGCTTPTTCVGAACTTTTCVGANCTITPCSGAGCTTPPICVGPDCNTTCVGADCTTPTDPPPTACVGVGCTTPTTCVGAACTTTTCVGANCTITPCSGAGCTTPPICVGPDCNTTCVGADCTTPTDPPPTTCVGVGCTTPTTCVGAACTTTTCVGADCTITTCSGAGCTTPPICEGPDCNTICVGTGCPPPPCVGAACGTGSAGKRISWRQLR